MKWDKVGRTVRSDGTTINRYECGDMAIESRKEPIPHANRSGYWMHTTYVLIKDGEEKTYYSLRDAKAAAFEQKDEYLEKKLAEIREEIHAEAETD